MNELKYTFYEKLKKVYDYNISRVVYLSGNISDLFYAENKYVNLVQFLLFKVSNSGNIIPIVYEINGPIRVNDLHRKQLEDIWSKWSKDETFNDKWLNSVGKPHYGLEFLRQLTIANRAGGSKYSLFIIIESADTMLPSADFAHLNIADRRSITICKDWFSDPDFLESSDSILLITESISTINKLITKLPQSIEVEVVLPNEEQRFYYLKFLGRNENFLPHLTGGLTLQSIRQMSVAKGNEPIEIQDVYEQIKIFISKELSGLVEFKKPTHTLNDIIGNKLLKDFLYNELIPRIRATGEESISGAAVSGPIGSGKTFIFEGVAGEIGCPVLTLNLRNSLYGETELDQKRFERIIEPLNKVIVCIDEADTEFGKLDSNNELSVEKRLVGKIQSMMSDNRFRGKVIWLLMTARIHLISDDIKRPGRAGDLIIPVFDPSDEDIVDFCRWTIKHLNLEDQEKIVQRMSNHEYIKKYSAASFASLKSVFIAKKPKSWEGIVSIVEDIIPSDIEKTRKYQILQALLNCTRVSLLMTENSVRQKLINKNNIVERNNTIVSLRTKWQQEIAELGNG